MTEEKDTNQMIQKSMERRIQTLQFYMNTFVNYPGLFIKVLIIHLLLQFRDWMTGWDMREFMYQDPLIVSSRGTGTINEDNEVENYELLSFDLMRIPKSRKGREAEFLLWVHILQRWLFVGVLLGLIILNLS